ncbi:ATP-binding cassette domain-containing protein [Nonomuraea sp. NPDC048916]|uniref:ABC transporter ATP-binding protein n=1 Tax=Nonomuraea sp. NPDC048916 TaxID=3154232 RepID=UPI0033F3F045
MRLSKVSFRYRRRERYVIEDLHTRLSPGEAIELTGVNGAGKSTLLRLLAGVTKPTSGTITDRPPVVAFAPDRFPVEQPFTVAGYLRRMSRVRGGARWEPWAERLRMTHLLDVRLGELSKGSAHKVGLAQALMAGPGLLILDEPFAGLDEDTRAVLPEILTEVTARGGIAVVSDHQGGLRDFPAIRHWSLSDGHLTDRPALLSPVPEAFAGPTATVEVTVPAGEMAAFLGRMRDEGYQARAVAHEEAT